MALHPDPEIVAALMPILEAAGDAPLPAAGDVTSRRASSITLFDALSARMPVTPDVTHDTYSIDVEGGSIEVRHYSRSGDQPGSAVVYIHGGGMISGSLSGYDAIIRGYVQDSGVPFFAMEYRLAPEFPAPTPVEDAWAVLRWVHENAASIGIDPSRIAVMGDSAGGGIAAGLALLARDRGGPAIATQILIYPMLDHRNTTPDPEIGDLLTWSYDDNVTGWGALLGEGHLERAASEYASPIDADSLGNLPPAYIDVGQLDIFRDEDLAYAARLSRAGVSVEIHVHAGAPHGFEIFAPNAAVSRRARADRIRRIVSF